MRLLVTAGSSYLGRQVLRRLLAGQAAPSQDPSFAYTYYSADPLGLPSGRKLDVRDAAAVMGLVEAFRPDTIIHLAGSNRTPDMEAVIVRGAAHIVEAAAARGVRLVHVSTDSVFDGRHAPYNESALPAPLNDYGLAKAEAETVVQNYANAVIVRTSLIYGLDEMDNGTAWMAKALRAGKPVKLFGNQRRNPVWVESLAAALLELAAPGHPFAGVLNVAGSQVMTRAEFGLRMLEWWAVGERETLSIGEDDSGRWALDCEMDLSLARRTLRTPLPGVDDVLARAVRG